MHSSKVGLTISNQSVTVLLNLIIPDDLNSTICICFNPRMSLKVVDPKTSLPKFVFLQWQGESALATRKGKAATHVR